MKRRYIMGKNPIMEVLKTVPERLCQVYTSAGTRDPLCAQLRKAGVRVKETPKGELAQLVNSDSHQGFVAQVQPREEITLTDFLERIAGKERSVVLLLDSIFDPQNFGAILRSAECFGVDLVVYSKNRGAEITPVVTKTSAGATELIDILQVSNLVETLKKFQKEDFWAVACEAKDRSEELGSFEFPKKLVLVMGSEGKGIQPLLSKTCDFHLKIPMKGQIDSLNVAQATAVLLSHCLY